MAPIPAAAPAQKRFTPNEAEALQSAADQLDALWNLDAERGLRDSPGGSEYQRLSPANTIRRMLDEESA
jgi:hypothetical protein